MDKGEKSCFQGSEVKTQVGHIARVGWGTGHLRERSKVIFGGGEGSPLPQIMTIIAVTKHCVSDPVLNALCIES